MMYLRWALIRLCLPGFFLSILLSAQLAFAQGIWLSPEEIAALPASGPAWDRLTSAADGNFSSDHGWEGNSSHNTDTLAAALVAARLGLNAGGSAYRSKAADEIMAAVRDPSWDDFHALTYPSRAMAAYVIAAQIIDFPNYPGRQADEEEFRTFIARWRFHCYGSQSNFQQFLDRPNNKGTMAVASEAAIVVYLLTYGNSDDACTNGSPGSSCIPDKAGQSSIAEVEQYCADPAAELDKLAAVFKGYLGDRATYDGFDFQSPAGDDWQANENESQQSGTGNGYGVNPPGSTRDGHDLSGVLPDDQRRGGGFVWPPFKNNYVYTAMQGVVVAATIFAKQGYDVWNWENQAIKRAWDWVHTPHFNDGTAFTSLDTVAGSNDGWQGWLVNDAYGTTYPTSSASTGFLMAWTEWTHQNMAGPGADQDGDGIADDADNCLEVANVDQRDSNGDGLGNICDADLDDNCVVNVGDLGIIRLVFFGDDADADFNGDGQVNVADLGIMRQAFFMPPGPSGVPNICDTR